MSYNISKLAEYINGNGRLIYTDTIMTANSFEFLAVQKDIKHKARVLDLRDNGTVLQTGSYEGQSNYSGGVALSDVDIEVVEFFVKEKYSAKQLAEKVANLAMKAGTQADDFPFHDAILAMKKQSLNNAIEKALWAGDKSGADKFDGFLTQILAATAEKAAKTGTLVKLTKTNAIDEVEKIIDGAKVQFPTWHDKELIMGMSPEQFSTYYRVVFKQNQAVDKNTHDVKPVLSFIIPGTNITVFSCAGMVDNDNIILCDANNLVIGIDGAGEDERFELKYLDSELFWRLFVNFKLGAKVIRTNEVFVTKAAA